MRKGLGVCVCVEDDGVMAVTPCTCVLALGTAMLMHVRSKATTSRIIPQVHGGHVNQLLRYMVAGRAHKPAALVGTNLQPELGSSVSSDSGPGHEVCGRTRNLLEFPMAKA